MVKRSTALTLTVQIVHVSTCSSVHVQSRFTTREDLAFPMASVVHVELLYGIDNRGFFSNKIPLSKL